MKLELLKNNLSSIITNTERIAGKNLTLPILQTVLLEAVDNKFIIKATNLEFGLKQKINTKIEKEGKVAVEAKLLSLFLNNINTNEKITLEADNGNLKINTNKIKTIIKGYQIDEFPIIPNPIGKTFLINSQDLVIGIKSVVYAGSISNIKPEIASVYLYFDGENYVFVSTDSFRLAEKSIVNKEQINFPKVIIPLKTSLEILKIFADLNEVLTLKINQNQLAISNNNLDFICQIINGVYPDYRQIIPLKFKTKITITKNDLNDYLKAANIFSDKFNQIKIEFHKNDTLIIESKNQNSGEYTANLKVKIEGEEGEVFLNAKYLIEGLQSINQTSLSINLNEKNKPILIQGIGDQSFKYLVMPVIR